jgi:hypothetical protein
MQGTTKDGHSAWNGKCGVAGARVTSADASGAAVNVTDAPLSNEQQVITDVLISVDTAMRVDLKEETSGDVKASLYLAANTAAQVTLRSKLKLAAAKRLQVQTSAAGNIAVTALYYPENVPA